MNQPFQQAATSPINKLKQSTEQKVAEREEWMNRMEMPHANGQEKGFLLHSKGNS
jgi:hypothetical protein